MRTSLVRIVGVVGVLVFCSVAASGAPVEFTLDPARSTFQLGGTFNGTPLVAQMPGSDVTGYTGTLLVDIDREAGTLSFSAAPPRAVDQPVDQVPLTDFRQGASYGLTAPGTGPVFFAARAVHLNVGGIDAPFNGAAATFEQVTFFVDGGTLYYGTGPTVVGGPDLHGLGGGDRVAGPVTLTLAGDTETLTVPIRTQFSPFTGGSDEINFTLAGQLVATRVVPEPATAACFLGLALVLRRRGYHFRRRYSVR